jgi:phosphoenolpyruvate carboxylase
VQDGVLTRVRAALKDTLLVTINGIANGMRNSG